METSSTIRKLFLCLLCLVPICKGFSQHTCYTINDTTPLPPGTKHSCFGNAHTPKGDLHILVVFIGYNNTGTIGVPNPSWSTPSETGYWPEDTIPSIAWNTSSIPGMNQLFNSDPSTIMAAGQEQNLSQYYYMMSNGKFRLTADIYPELVKVDYNVNVTDSFLVKRDSLEKMNQYALAWIQNNHASQVDPNGQPFDWSKYDNRTNNPQFTYDNSASSPDNKIDYVVFMHRRSIYGITGKAGQTSFSIPTTSYNVDIKSTHYGSDCSPEPNRNYDYFTHEFAHNLFRAEHYMGANGNVPGNNYNSHFGWGMMSRELPVLFTANAWERWWLGWNKPDSIYQDTTIILYDFLDSDTTKTTSIQIPIPGSGGHMLWLENHQLKEKWDEKPFYDYTADIQIKKGIFAYSTYKGLDSLLSPDWSQNFPPPSDSTIIDPVLQTAKVYYSDSTVYDGPSTNGMRTYQRVGNLDFQLLPDPCSFVPGTNNGVCGLLFNQDSTFAKPNPFSGSTYLQTLAFDLDSNGKINHVPITTAVSSGPASERKTVWREYIGGIDSFTFANTGIGQIAFIEGDTIGLSAANPVTYLPDFYEGYSTVQLYSIDPQNKGFISEQTTRFLTKDYQQINGIQIEIVSHDSTAGSYELDIKFNVWEIRSDKRWCGLLSLPDLGGDTLVLFPNQNLLLDLSESPNLILKDSITNTFSRPTELLLQSGAHLYLDANSTMDIQRHSQLVLKAGSILELADGATLNVKNTGSLIAEPGSIIKVHGAGEILIKQGGFFSYADAPSQSLSSYLELLDNSSCIRIEGDLEIGDNTLFTFTGDGFLALDLPSAGFFQGNITVGTDASIELEGSGTSDKILFVEDGSYFLPGGLENFSLKNGKVEMGSGAQILLFPTGDSLILENLTIEAANYPSKHNGVFFIEHGNHRLNNLTITDGAPGMGSWQGLNPNGQRLKITNSTFANNDIGLHTFGGSAELVNCNFVNSQKGWQADVAVIPGEIMGGSIQGNADRGIRYFGPGDLHLEDLYLASQVAGLDLYGHSTLTGECVEFASHTGYASLLANGAGADLYPYLGSNYPQWEFNNNNYSIVLDSVHHILINDGYTNLRAGASGPNTLLGSQRVNLPPGLSYDASHNRWNTANTSPVSGIDYQVISDLGSITFSDPSPGSVACPTNPCPSCSDENPDGNLPLFACSECQSVSILVDPASSGGEPLEQGYDEHLVEAMRMISTIGSSGSDDEEAAWRLLSLAVYSLSSPNSDEIWLQGIAHRLLLRAMNAAALSGVLTRADSSGLSMDALSTAFVDYLDDQISATSDYSLLAMYQINKAAFLRTLGDRSGSLSEFEDIRSEVLGNDRDMVDQWICLLEYEDDLYTQQIDPVTFWSLVQSCTNGETTARREAPQSDSKATSILEEFGVKVYPNPATHTLKIEMNVPQETDVTLTLLNANGQLVHSTPQQSISVGEFIWTIPTEELPSGIYLLQINTGLGIENRRVIVE